jgi:HK97 family phage major capsid protein
MAPKVNGIPIPASATELEEMYRDPKVFAKVYADKDTSDEFIRKYAASMIASDPELKAQLNEVLQAGVQEMTGGDARVGAKFSGGRPDLNVNGVPVSAAVSMGKGAVYNRAAPGARMEQSLKPDELFASIGEYCQAIREEARPTATRRRDELLRKLTNVREFMNSFGSEESGAGGFLIPEIMRADLLMLALEQSVVRSRATVIPMTTLSVPIPTVDDTSHATTVFGGVQFYWAEEAASITESTATFGRVTLTAKKLAGFFKVPNELLADAPAFSTFFDTRIPQGLAWFEDLAFMTETGAGTPQGFINCPASVNVAKESGQTAATIVWENIVKMYARMLPTSLGNAVWVANIDTFPQLATMALSVGTGGGPVWIGVYGGPSGSQTPPMTILGRPVFFTEKVSALGTPGDINFVDLSYYLIGDRQAVEVSASEHAFFQNDQTAFKIIERVDGRPWLQSALTPHSDATNTLTAFVQLATR